ncbi:MAG: ferritin family protein [Deltaproteobacteria bacterium]|nr:ferritin family protein [Deltaproteobacteria bacterium]
MEQFKTAEDILDYAISEEEAAAQFYTELAARMTSPGTKKIFEGFAREEEGHKAKLVAVKEGRKLDLSTEKVADLKIGDYLVDVEVKSGMGYQDALIVAMKKEKAAFRLYSDLAAAADNPEVTELFLALAQEEAKHKLRFEVEYDERVLVEN